MGFIDIPVDGSTNFPDDIMDSIEPYDYSQFTKFNYSYLSGFLAEQYDMEPEEVYERAKIRAENTTKDKLMETILGKYTTVSVTSENVNVQNGEIEYALLPVWMLNTIYKGERYTFAMNGQTGKLIGNVPIDKSKLIKTFLKYFGLIVIVVVLIMMLLGGN